MNLTDSEFVMVGRRKLRGSDIVSIASYPEKGPSSPERVIILLTSSDQIIVPSSEPHFAQALALYHAIDAVDVLVSAPAAEGKPAGPWTPGKVLDLFAGWEPEECGVTVSLMILKGEVPCIKVIGAAETAKGKSITEEWTLCFCPKCIAKASYVADVCRIKARIIARFATAPVTVPSAN